MISKQSKKPVDLTTIQTTLKNSFSAIKLDITYLKDVQDKFSKSFSTLKEDIKQFKKESATLDDLKIIDDRFKAIEARQENMTARMDEVSEFSEQVVEAVNERIRELNTQFEKIIDVRDTLMRKLKRFDALDSKFEAFEKQAISKEQVKALIKDIQGEFKSFEKKLATQKEMEKVKAKLSRIERNL